MRGANPRFSDGLEWQNNCQRCVVAYEMRRRGYNVTAQPAEIDESGLPLRDYIATHWDEVFEGKLIPCPNGNGSEDVEYLMRKWGKGARAIVKVSWDEINGHVFIAEMTRNGVQYIDPQSASYRAKSNFYMCLSGQTAIMRIDNAVLSHLGFLACKEEK